MSIAYYIIPMVAGPYSRTNKQRPDYVDEIQCNWTGHNIDDYGVYLCKVNTTDAKHTDLASRSGVRQLPRSANLNTVISTLPAAAQNAISNWCNNKDIPYDSSDTIGELLARIIGSGVFKLGNATLTTQYQNLTQTQKDRITLICNRWGWALPSDTDTVAQIGKRLGKLSWPVHDDSKIWVEEF